MSDMNTVPSESDRSRDRAEIPVRDKAVMSEMGFNIGNLIGSGQNAFVYHGVLNENFRRIQKIGDQYISESFAGTEFAVKFTEISGYHSRRESELWSELEHPFIVDLLYVLVKNKRLYIFMEYADKGSIGEQITDLVKQGRGTEKIFSQNQCLLFIQQLSEGLEYIHKKGIIHKDIQSKNALIYSAQHPNGYLTAKWSDFSLSQRSGDVRDDLLPFGYVIQDISEYTQFLSNQLYEELIDLREKLIGEIIIRVEHLYKQYENVYNINPLPETCCEIESHLFLGNFDAAVNAKNIKSLNIKRILSVIDVEIPENKRLPEIIYKRIHAEDMSSDDLLSSFPECIQFITDGQNSGQNVLVHCMAGISRSATIVIAFVMSKYKIPYQKARELVSKKRIIDPNPGDVEQLKLFEKMQFRIDQNNVEYKEHVKKCSFN